MKDICIKPTSQVMYLIRQISKSYDHPKKVGILAEALNYVTVKNIDWNEVFAKLKNASFVTLCLREEYPDTPSIVHFCLTGEDEANYLKIENDIKKAGVTSRPQAIAVVKAVLFAYFEALSTSNTQQKDCVFDADFDRLSTDEKLALINVKLDFLTQKAHQIANFLK